MKNKVLLAALLCGISYGTFSQASIKGKLLDSSSGKPLGLATVTVFKAADTILITYRLSTPEGEFKVPGLPHDVNCRVLVSFTGYVAYRKEFKISKDQQELDLGNIKMKPSSSSLEEVLVIAERPPVVIKKDTIEFNASAFKTLPNALVEDLLKKLPGVQVDKDGNIMVNGKPVNRILVDGKTFFGDDPKMATRNLPANVIDKVQVTDDKEEMMRNGDDNLNNVGKVVNITLKKGVKKGWFGKLYAGAGTQNLYEGGGIANIYRDTFQISVLGYLNNMNKPGFSYSELMQAGGLDRTRGNMSSNSTSIWNNSSGGSGVSINGVNFGGAQNYGGIATSKGAGFNLNHSPNSKRSFYLQYFRGNVVINRTNLNDVSQYTADTIINNNTRLTGDVETNAHNIGIGARLKPDSVTNILVNANYLIGMQDEQKISAIQSSNNKLGNLSYGDINQYNPANTYAYRHSISITRLSKKKKGRRFNFNHNLDINNRYNDYTTESALHFLNPVMYDSLSAQLRLERIPRTDAVVNLNYSEPVNKKFALRFSSRYEYSELHNSINTFNWNNATMQYDVLNAQLSSQSQRFSNRFLLQEGIEFKWKNLTITPYLRQLWQHVDNKFASLAAPIKQVQFSMLPQLNLSYKTLNIGYGKDLVLPSFNNLIPVRDNTNPYFIWKGNPSLLPSTRNSISVNYNFNNPRKNFNAGVYANGNFTNNDVIQSISVDDKGVQTSMPVNADGSSNFYINFNLYKQYKHNPKRIFTWNTGANYGFNHSRLLFNSESSWQTSYNVNNWVGGSVNFNDKVEYNLSYGIGYSITDYTSASFKKLKVQSQNIDNELVVRWPKHLIWETQLNYSYNSRQLPGLPKAIIRWNAALNITMLKNEAGVLKLAIWDILDQNLNAYAYANRNTITASQTNALSQYFMATFTYNVRAAGMKKKVGGRERLFFF